MLAEKKDSDEIFAVKSIKKKSTVENDEVKYVFTEKRVSALASGYPFVTTLHSTFQTVVNVWHKTLKPVHNTPKTLEIAFHSEN